MLTNEGRARFRRMKTAADAAAAGAEAYKILDYLYEIGAGTIDEIGAYIGLSWDQVVSQLQGLLNHGFVEETD